MKRISIGVLAAAASGLGLGHASAADLPLKASPPPLPLAYRWSGFYLGGHLGGGWLGNDPATVTTNFFLGGFPPFAPTSFSSSGGSSFLGGAQVGYNWQFDSHWVAGVEADWTSTKFSEAVGGALPGGAAGGYASSLRRDVNSLMSVRGRVGYASDAMLYYFTGGLAWGHAGYSANTGSQFPTFPTTFSNVAHGYVVGGGLEYALNTNWLVRAEYLYYHLDGATQNALSIDANPPGTDGFANYQWNAFQANVVRFGVDYKFGQ